MFKFDANYKINPNKQRSKPLFTTQMKLKRAYYLQPNVVKIAKDLIGKVLVSKTGNTLTSGIITETEAYNGIVDKASHAFGGRRTERTETMFSEGGISYVYLCYGIHNLFNIVTNVKDVPHAVLIRAIQPLRGEKYILERRNAKSLSKNLCVGPGKVTSALAITRQHNAIDLSGNIIWLEDDNIKPKNILVGPRIGVDYAGEDAKLPYRFWSECEL
jgi:DNA-3-methyladenine glycosylase